MSSNIINPVPKGFTLTFEDNFDNVGGQPSADHWTYDLGDGSAAGIPGWGNGESQVYESDLDNVHIIDLIARDSGEADTDGANDNINGALRIVANKTGDEITSARIKSDIGEIGSHGYYEVRAKIPPESGAWPAIWLLGDVGNGNWPDVGEIDLMEWSSGLSYPSNQISSALHFRGTADQQPSFGGTQFYNETTLSSSVEEWHTYQVWWSPDEIRVGVDGNSDNAHLVYTKRPGATNDDWPFDGPMDLIMNIAIGGNMGGAVPADDFEYEMLVDYVRVYQGDWSAVRSDGYVAAAEGVVSLLSDVYPDEADTDWNPWGVVASYAFVDGSHKYTGVDYFGIEPAAPLDLSSQDTVHLRIYRTDADADLSITLVDYGSDGQWEQSTNAEGTVTFASGTNDAVVANQWVDLVIPKASFGLATDAHVGQIKVESSKGAGASGETIYIEQLYASASTVSGPATDADPELSEYKDVVMLQGDESTVDVGTNFFYNGTATGVTTVSLGGDNFVQKYGDTGGYIQIRPEEPIDISGLTTLHMSVYRTGGQLDTWGSADLKVRLVYEGDTPDDDYWFSATRGDEAVPDQWNNLELPLAWMANGQASGAKVTDIILVGERWNGGAKTNETLYLDKLSFSAKADPMIPQEAPPSPADDPLDVISIYSDDYDSAVTNFDPVYRWSLIGETPSGSEQTMANIGGREVQVIQNAGMAAMTFSYDEYAYPRADRLDVSSADTLKLTVFRTDPTAQLRFELRFANENTTYDEVGNGVSESVYFDASTSFGAVPAGQWHTIEIPLSAFGNGVDLTQVTGVMMYSFDPEYVLRTDANGDPVGDDYETVLTDPATYLYDPVPSRETIYLDELYFAATPDAPRTAPADPGHAPDDVIAAFIGDAYSTDGFSGQGTVFNIDGGNVQKWENLTAQIQISPATPFTLASSASANAPIMHLDIWLAVASDQPDIRVRTDHRPVSGRAHEPVGGPRGACPRRVPSGAGGDGPRGAGDR